MVKKAEVSLMSTTNSKANTVTVPLSETVSVPSKPPAAKPGETTVTVTTPPPAPVPEVTITGPGTTP